VQELCARRVGLPAAEARFVRRQRRMLDTFVVMLAYWQLRLLRGDEVPGKATAALLAGLDSSNLRVLAGLEAPTRDDVAPYLARAAQELGVLMPTERDAGFTVARDIARRILAGEVRPHEGARRIWFDVYNRIAFPKELSIFRGPS
jgi:hypothetical protein